jgi:lipoprotein signal peptidase
MNKRWVIIVAEVVLCLVIGPLLAFKSENGYLAAVGLGLIIGGVGAAIAVAITVLRKRTKQK